MTEMANERGQIWVEHGGYEILKESLKCDPCDEPKSHPCSYLWVGGVQMNRDEVSKIAAHLECWLNNGRLDW